MLYTVQKKDIHKAGGILADAFQHDPVWLKLFEGEPNRNQKFQAFFEVPVRYCIKYGEVYATSENLEGIAAWIPGRLADMALWRIILSGAIGPGLRMGFRPSRKMNPSFELLQRDRRTHMDGKPYVYLQIVGVATRFQGQGFGGKLIRALLEKCDRDKLPVYLETETEDNVRMYQRYGFKLLQQITLPNFGLPMWEMVREK
ncbi:MAG: GNAT family N-acetyltransferase [Chitinivibrionales bacterium]